jgi:arylsulfatase A-like enzyme
VRAAPAARADARPNVVVVLVDDMGWSDIGTYGGEIPTPNLDALARGGVRFTQFYATPRCSPTRASLLTGLYPHQAGMGHLDNVVRPGSSGTTGRLSDRSVTIAEVLRAAGYVTAMSGKWHLGQDNGSPPWQRGFDRVLSLRAGGMYSQPELPRRRRCADRPGSRAALPRRHAHAARRGRLRRPLVRDGSYQTMTSEDRGEDEAIAAASSRVARRLRVDDSPESRSPRRRKK